MGSATLLFLRRSAQRSFAQPAACLHVPAALTREDAKHEGLQPRANERHAVGWSEELARSLCAGTYRIVAVTEYSLTDE